MQGLAVEKWTSPSKITAKTDSRTAKAVAICEIARTRTKTSLKPKSDRAGDLKIMNPVILIYNAQMFFRNFGLRHATAALGEFAIGLAGPNASQKIARFARPAEWLRFQKRR